MPKIAEIFFQHIVNAECSNSFDPFRYSARTEVRAQSIPINPNPIQ